MKKIIILFPGQGSQKVGMGKNLIENSSIAKKLFQDANDILNKDLLNICLEGPQETLNLTINAQPALFVLSMGLFYHLKETGIQASLFAGHSLGELCAYHAANVLDFKTSLKLIETRANAMANAHPQSDSAMAAIIGLNEDLIQEELKKCQNTIVAANFNAPSQTVISGNKKGFEEAALYLKKAGGKIIPLPVSGAFHSPLMQTASIALKDYCQNLTFSKADTPILLNQHAIPEQDAQKLKENVSQQVVSSVHWHKGISHHQDQAIFIECGVGTVLKNLNKKIDKGIKTLSLQSLEDLEEITNILKEDKAHV